MRQPLVIATVFLVSCAVTILLLHSPSGLERASAKPSKSDDVHRWAQPKNLSYSFDPGTDAADEQIIQGLTTLLETQDLTREVFIAPTTQPVNRRWLPE